MKIVFQNAGKTVSHSDLENDVILKMPVPAEVTAAVGAGKTVWYSSSSSVQNIGSKDNANKQIRLSAANNTANLGRASNTVLSHVCAIEEVFGNPNNTVLSGDAATFTMGAVTEGTVCFSARRLEALLPSDNLYFYATANFFIPE